jgi:hypothetical protein
VEIEFFEPAEAAALMRCTESWLRDGATIGRFSHACCRLSWMRCARRCWSLKIASMLDARNS